MESIADAILVLAKEYRKSGIEPNRVRMSRSTHVALREELGMEGGGKLSETAGLSIEVWWTCPLESIYVDAKPDDEELGELETRLRAQYGDPNAK